MLVCAESNRAFAQFHSGKVARNGLGVRGSEAVICQYFPTNGNSVCDSKVGITHPDNFRL